MIDVIMVPTATILVGEFDKLGLDIRSFREPLTRAVREVATVSIRQNFDESGRPSWAELSPITESIRGSRGYTTDMPLVRTGKLRRVASQINAWSVDGQGGTATYTLPSSADYGEYHITGTSRMPSRDFAVLQDEDIDAITDVFDRWLDERLVSAGFR